MWLLLLTVAAGAGAALVAGRGGPSPAAGHHAATGPAHADPSQADPAPGRDIPSVVTAAAGLILLAAGRWVPGDAGVAIVCAGYALMGAMALVAWRGGRRPGLLLVAVGLAANLAVVAADRGMPVWGLPAGVPAGSHHHGLSSRDHLGALADVIRLAPLHETVSAGDMALAVGAAVAVFASLRRRQAAPGPAAGSAGSSLPTP